MKHKYGEYEIAQFESCKNRIHSLVHWLLIYAEETTKTKSDKDDNLMNYFEKVQYKISGYNELLLYPSQLVEIQALIESARLEYLKDNYSHERYRKMILDAHDLIDKIPVGE